MKRNSQLSGVLHILLHMAERDEPVTSELLARAIGTNPVVIRRLMAGLRDQGYVQSEKGHGGGWVLARRLSDVTLRDIYTALGCSPLIAIGNRTESPGCVIEQAVNGALDHVLADAEALLLDRLDAVTLAELHRKVHGKLPARGARHRLEVAHAQ
jgi:Rrf2 family protein